jgi:hypothetical protein
VDLGPSAWKKEDRRVRQTAQLFVDGAIEPWLIVSDLKMEQTSGKIALWAH